MISPRYQRVSSSAVNRSSVHLAVVMPHSFFNGKEYQKKMYAAANGLARLEFTVGVFSVLQFGFSNCLGLQTHERNTINTGISLTNGKWENLIWLSGSQDFSSFYISFYRKYKQ